MSPFFFSALAPADFNRRGVNDRVLNPGVGEEVVNLKAIAAGFVARQRRGVRGEVDAEYGLRDLVRAYGMVSDPAKPPETVNQPITTPRMGRSPFAEDGLRRR
jgi:hypothetical protein